MNQVALEVLYFDFLARLRAGSSEGCCSDGVLNEKWIASVGVTMSGLVEW